MANDGFHAHLPEQCEPTTLFLRQLSAAFHTCIPTSLAFVSTLLGFLSILSWLFAQLPQILRNYKNQSTAGLSVFFLVEWCLGDLANLFGAILTQQATWQIIVGAYYCFVDITLVLQWLWYERFKHGRPLKRIRFSTERNSHIREGTDGRLLNAQEWEGRAESSLQAGQNASVTGGNASTPQDIPSTKAAHASEMFATPIYGTMSPPTNLAGSPASRSIHRIQQQALPSPTPRIVLLITLLMALASTHASPISLLDMQIQSESAEAWSLGTLLSWTSTLLYLLSRLPQIILNFRRKSTSGLSPTLFAAAFCGNLFYSSSLLVNPCAWSSFGPHGGRGWAGPEGSRQREWVEAALPFFLGAAGVLGLDGAVGVQFRLYGEGEKTGEEEEVLVVQESPKLGAKEKALRMRRISGWMRGWQPSASGRISPVLKVRRIDEEREALLTSSRHGSASGRSAEPRT